MSFSHEFKKISEGSKLFSGFAFKSKDFTSLGIPIIKIKNVNNRVVNFHDLDYYPENLVKKEHQKFFLKDKDVLIAMTGQGSVGRVGRITINKKEKMLLNQRVGKFITNNNVLDSDYLYHVISSPQYEKILFDRAIGSGQPNLSPDDILSTEIPFPIIEIQKKISKILNCIDIKIIINQKINKNLEEQAQKIFRKYLIDYDKFLTSEIAKKIHPKIPAKWEHRNLTDISNYLNGLAMQKYPPKANDIGIPVLKIRELRQGFCNDSSDICSSNIENEYIIENGDVIFSWSGSLLVDFWCGDKCGLNQHLFKVTSEKYDKWFYYLWTKFHLEKFIEIAKDKATTMGHIKRKDLEDSDVIIPDKITYGYFNNLFDPIFDKIICNRVESFKLSKIRNIMLPKLMSGEIDVSNISLNFK